MPGKPTGMLVVIPSSLGVGEPFSVKVKVLGQIVEVPSLARGGAGRPRVSLLGPFNASPRGFRFCDNGLPEWQGALEVDGGPALIGPRTLTFDGVDQGVYEGDSRPTRTFEGFRWGEPGFHFVKVMDPVSGVEASSNPVRVSRGVPPTRIYWGDPHWQTFFSDGLRGPEELYTFARDEAFLDFGALSDHAEALTDHQWLYFVAATNAFNEPGRFATLVGLEWTNSRCGHRNVYYRGDCGPLLRSSDPDTATLDRLWARLEGLEAVAIPHHSASRDMGVDWSLGWNPTYEKAVEIHSIWGNSERHHNDGNALYVKNTRQGGEARGQHVIDALRLGYRFGFVGGGDIHHGRPGDDLSCDPRAAGDRAQDLRPQGLTAVFTPSLSRERVYDAIKSRRTYATTKSRIYLHVVMQRDGARQRLHVQGASEDGIRKATLVHDGEDLLELTPAYDPRILTTSRVLEAPGPNSFRYVRLETEQGNFAWSSPQWGDEPSNETNGQPPDQVEHLKGRQGDG